MSSLETWELASYIVTSLGLPYAILLFWYESRKERQTENEGIYQALSEEYSKFAQLLIQNADLQLMTGNIPDADLTSEQTERKKIIFDVLLGLFERAYILVYEEDMNQQTRRLWATWEDYITFWCKRSDFRRELPALLTGEDPDFVAYIKSVAKI